MQNNANITPQTNTQKLGVINGLRGFAILSVLYYHVFSRLIPPGYKSRIYAGITILPFTHLSSAWLGVNLFFLLSGFVLAYPYFLGKRGFTAPSDFKEFYLRRAKRMLPLYYFSVVFCIVFISQRVSLPEFPREALLLATVTFNFTKDMWFPSYNWVLWSLGIEVWFSVIFPFLIISIRKFGIYKVLVIVLVASLVTRIIGNAEIYNIGSPLLNPVKDSLLGRLDEFLWGMFLCYVYVNKREWSTKTPTSIPLLAGITMITLACFSWDYVRLKILTHGFIPYINPILDIGFVLLAWSLLIMKDNPIRWLFSNYFVQLLGVMCYSIYIWHGLAIKPLILEYDAVQIIIYYCFALLIASLSYRFIEFGHDPNWRKLFLLDQ